MRITDMHWQQVEDYLKRDDRCILPLGSTEQHAYLSLSVDSLLAEKVALDAAEPLGIPVFPVMHYGLTPYFRAYPGSITLRAETYLALLRDILASMKEQGFKRVMIVNGHGGNSPGMAVAREFTSDGLRVKWHNWWNAPKTWEIVKATDPDCSHASWMENFPWTRLQGVAQPQVKKPMPDMVRLDSMTAQETRDYLGDGSFGGWYERPDAEMLAIWDVAVAETRASLDGAWG